MAGNAILKEQTLNEQIASLNEQMETLAADGSWDEIEQLLARRNAMLREIDDADRNAALNAARRSTDRIRRLAEQAQGEVREKLAQLQRGKEATDSYRAYA